MNSKAFLFCEAFLAKFTFKGLEAQMGALVSMQVVFCGKGTTALCTGERFLTPVSPHVDCNK